MASSLAPSLSLALSPSRAQHQRRLVLCQASEARQPSRPEKAVKKLDVSRRELLSATAASASASGVLLLSLSPAALALLEADDDDQLLEKVKEDRKKKMKKRGEVNSLKEETASVQAAVYQLSQAGQALDGEDFSAASKALGGNLNEAWITDVEKALSKVSSSEEEQSEVEVFSTALASLQSAVIKQDLDLSKSAFVKSAGALEKWSYLTGFAEQLKGL